MKDLQRGFSLLVVLAALAIMSLLLLALLSGATHGLRFSRGEASLARETMLADSAATLVMAQLQQATTVAGQAWISQPGLIRTYSAAAGATRVPNGYYKLYSSSQMTEPGGGLSFLAADVPADWNSASNLSVYTDLNAPVQSLLGSSIYPILDVSAVNKVTGLSADAGHGVEMPVAWLYELQDGTIGAPTAATAQNPIVGRVAFWTDDETSKIDLNTAGELSSWNTPRTSSSDDTGWATVQPAGGEFERYPGHPAGISLDVLFGAGTTANLTADQLLALTPRYAAGGTDFGAQTTTALSSVTPKNDRLYGSVDELSFGTGLNAAGQRIANSITPAELNLNRFVLTAHSESPETTLLGEPRVAIWPVSDVDDSSHRTATDRAVAYDATIGLIGATGATSYYLERHDPTSPTYDLDGTHEPGNAALYANLVAAGGEQLPGCSTTFEQKYPNAQWSQIVVEILDAIRGFNAVDPAAGPLSAPTSFVPFAPGDTTGVGRGLIVPLTASSGSVAVRGLGRYPTLFGLTLVLYVSGFGGFSDGTPAIDYEAAPDVQAGTSWTSNFLPVKTSKWSKVTQALVRAFVVPTTYQPNCGFPEVSDACTIRITGLDTLTATSPGAAASGVANSFGFPHVCTSGLLSDALKVLPPDRAWGGFEGPLAWRAAAAPTAVPYAFAGNTPFSVPSNGTKDSLTNGPSMPSCWKTISLQSTSLTVEIVDKASGQTVQTFALSLPAISGHVPTVNGEADQCEATPSHVLPSYYMTLSHRVQNTGADRPLMIQAGDLSYSLEAHTDLRLIAALSSVPASFFKGLPWTAIVTSQDGTHQHDLRFPDGTSACFCETQPRTLVSGDAYASKTSSFTVTDWRDGSSVIYPYATSPPPNGPTDPSYVTIGMPGATSVLHGDWDTGPGFEPDGALANPPDAGTTLDPVTAYESLSGGAFGAVTRYAPNALVPSPVVFGSLPAGINPTTPTSSQAWRTLLFCPYPASDQAHPGLASPPDYLLLDRFWMPVVEPYGISTRFATAGKINLNDQIAPFTYLHRNTALHALLRSLRIPAISPIYSGSYKTLPPPASFATSGAVWRTIDEDTTISQIESRFATGDAYLTEGEICSVPLVPQNLNGVTPETFWSTTSGKGFLTGDNLRELPYAQIYSRLTTRSNSYTVHIRAQVLQKRNDGTNPAVWREGIDHVLGDWRGSYEIERYLDPKATAPAAGQPLGPYKFRIVSARRFSP